MPCDDMAYKLMSALLSYLAWCNWLGVQGQQTDLVVRDYSIISRIVVEGYNKCCLDALGGDNHQTSWKNSMILEDIKVLQESFYCQFNWIKRQADIAAHKLSRWDLKTNYSGLCFSFQVSSQVFFWSCYQWQ